MGIRHQVEWDRKKYHGYVNAGVGLNDDFNDLAMFVFCLLFLTNSTWKVPCDYFFTDCFYSTQKANFVKNCC